MAEPEKKKLGLIPKLIIGIIVGTLVGLSGIEVLMRILETYRLLFGQIVLFFVIPLIVLAFVTVGIAEIGKGAGKYLGVIVVGAYLLTILAGYIGYGVTVLTEPLIVERGAAILAEDARPIAPSFINLTVAPVVSTMTAIVLSFILGSFMAGLDKDATINKLFRDFREIIMGFVLKIVVPGLPAFIGAVFARIAWQGQAAEMAFTFARVFLMIIIVHWAWILVHYFICGSLYKTSPFKLLRPMMGSYFMALGTQSSAATLTVNLPNVKKLGVDESAANFVVPLGATINLPGSTISIVACAVAVMFLFDMPVTLGIMTPFIMGVAIAMVAAPGVPGGAIVASLGVLEATLGFTDYQLALMMALYFAQDSFGTAVNVTTDGALCMYLNKYMGNNELKPMEA